MDDNRVMEEVKAGRVERLALLFEKHHVKLYNYYLRLTRNRSLSEDLVQDVFLRILKYRETFRADREFAVWLYAIARNAYMDHLRKHKETLPLEEAALAEPAGEGSPSQLLERNDAALLVRKALDRLPPSRREVLILSRYQEMNYAEIAEILHCRINTVKVQVHRAMKDLSRIYGRLQGGATS